MSRKNKIIVSVVGVLIITLALLGITYGYFLTRIVGNTNATSISITTANLRLVYNDGTTKILTQNNIIPGTTVSTKDFTVTNEGNSDISEYQVYLVSVINTFSEEGQDDVKLTITCTSTLSDGTTGTCNGYDSTYPTINSKLISNPIKVGEIHSYELVVEYEETNTDQSEDMGKTLQGKIQIYDPKDIIAVEGTVTNAEDGYYVEFQSDPVTSQIDENGKYLIPALTPGSHTISIKYIEDGGEKTHKTENIVIVKGTEANISSDKKTITIDDTIEKVTLDIDATDLSITDTTLVTFPKLADTIIANAQTAQSGTNRTIYSATPPTNIGSNSGENERILSIEEDDYTAITGENSYYFRGNVLDNYLDFAGMCWRIVRIEGDGSIKLIMEDKDNICKESNGNFDIGSGYFGYTEYPVGHFVSSDGTKSNSAPIYAIDYLHGNTANSESSMATIFKNYQDILNTKIANTYSGKTIDSMLKSGNWCFNDVAYSNNTSNYDSTTPLTTEQIEEHYALEIGYHYDDTITLNCIGKIMNTYEENETNPTPMYVATITKNEAHYAGIGDTNNDVYLLNEYYKLEEDDENYENFLAWSLLNIGDYFPTELGDGGCYGRYFIQSYGSLYGSSDYAHWTTSLRPAIQLKADTLTNGGTGLKTDAYQIKG